MQSKVKVSFVPQSWYSEVLIKASFIKGSIRVHDRFKRTTDGQIIEFISKWLRHAPENWQRMIDRSAVDNGSGEEPYEEEPYEDERAF